MATTTTRSANLAIDKQFYESVAPCFTSMEKIDVCVTLILRQPRFQNAEIDDHLDEDKQEHLPEHQDELKKTAQTWKDDVRKNLLKVNSSILAYNNKLGPYYDGIIKLANAIGTDCKAKNQVLEMLQKLRDEADEQRCQVKNAEEMLKKFQREMNRHCEDIFGDKEKLGLALKNGGAEVETIQQEIKSLEGQIKQSEDMRTAGIVVLFILPFIGIPLTAVGDINAKNLYRQKHDLMVRMNTVSKMICEAQCVYDQVNALTRVIDIVVQAANEIAIAWEELSNQYDDYIRALKDVDDLRFAGMVVAQLKTAKNAWDEVARIAKITQEQHLKPSTDYISVSLEELMKKY